MKVSYKSLVALLGKPKNELGDLLEAVDYSNVTGGDEIQFYDVRELGVSLTFNSCLGFFDSVTLFFANEKVQTEHFSSFTGELPFGIKLEDTRDTAESKMSGITQSVKDYRYHADLRPLIVTFHYDPTGTELMMISVDLETQFS